MNARKLRFLAAILMAAAAYADDFNPDPMPDPYPVTVDALNPATAPILSDQRGLYQQIGDVTLTPDGEMWQQTGQINVGPDGRLCQQIGGTVYCGH